jgi:hypothetical protein
MRNKHKRKGEKPPRETTMGHVYGFERQGVVSGFIAEVGKADFYDT